MHDLLLTGLYGICYICIGLIAGWNKIKTRKMTYAVGICFSIPIIFGYGHMIGNMHVFPISYIIVPSVSMIIFYIFHAFSIKNYWINYSILPLSVANYVWFMVFFSALFSRYGSYKDYYEISSQRMIFFFGLYLIVLLYAISYTYLSKKTLHIKIILSGILVLMTLTRFDGLGIYITGEYDIFWYFYFSNCIFLGIVFLTGRGKFFS